MSFPISANCFCFKHESEVATVIKTEPC